VKIIAMHHGHGHGPSHPQSQPHGRHSGTDPRPDDQERNEPITPLPGAIALIIERRHLSDGAIREARAALAEAGRPVQLVVPEPGRLFDVPAVLPSWSAVVSRGRMPAILALLAAASALDVLTINTPRAIDLVRNKVGMQAVLARHGLPLSRAWFAAEPVAFRDVPAECFPLLVKPFDGDGATGLWLITSPDDIALLPPADRPRPLYVAQQFLETDGWDLKLYGIGSDVWAVRKPAPFHFPGPGRGVPGPSADPEPVLLDAELRDIALTCGRACGLELWGVDIAVTSRGPVVIEVNDFPTYSAVPEAGARIAAHILALTELDALMRTAGQQQVRSLVRIVS
jgi:ribosomal protein S6--L-glutamate ligase